MTSSRGYLAMTHRPNPLASWFRVPCYISGLVFVLVEGNFDSVMHALKIVQSVHFSCYTAYTYQVGDMLLQQDNVCLHDDHASQHVRFSTTTLAADMIATSVSNWTCLVGWYLTPSINLSTMLYCITWCKRFGIMSCRMVFVNCTIVCKKVYSLHKHPRMVYMIY